MVARLLHGFHAQDMVSDLGQLLFFRVIFDFIHHETEQFGIGVLGRMTAWVGSVALALLTLWILWHGYRIVTGQNRQPAMVLRPATLRPRRHRQRRAKLRQAAQPLRRPPTTIRDRKFPAANKVAILKNPPADVSSAGFVLCEICLHPKAKSSGT